VHVLVTGATGFLGGHVADRLLARGHTVRALLRPGRAAESLVARGVETCVGDLSDERSLKAACRDVDGLVHCAERVGGGSRQEGEQHRINVEGSSALYRAARKVRTARIVHVSSAATVGCNKDGAVLDETTPWVGRDRPKLHYVTTKRESEERALAAASAGLPILAVNPAVTIGPGLDLGSAQGPVASALAGARRVPKGGGSVSDVADVTEGIVLALEQGRVGERYILGGHNLTWRELSEAARRQAGRAGRVREYPNALGRALASGMTVLDAARLARPSLAPERFRAWGWFTFVDSSKAQRELGYTVRPLAEILARACSRTGVPTP